MAEPAVKILNRHECIPAQITPTGRTLVIVQADPEKPFEPCGLFRVTWEKGGELPDGLQGWFTSTFRAGLAIKNYLGRLWDESDKEVNRLAAQKQKREQVSASI